MSRPIQTRRRRLQALVLAVVAIVLVVVEPFQTRRRRLQALVLAVVAIVLVVVEPFPKG